MTLPRIVGKSIAGVAALAVPAAFAVAGSGQAAADPDLCVSGPWGYASACIDSPEWVNWNPGPNWGAPGQIKKNWCPGNPPGHWKGGPHGIPCS
jgi:hypothetical protein